MIMFPPEATKQNPECPAQVPCDVDPAVLRWADDVETSDALDFLVFRAGAVHLAVDLSFVAGFCGHELDEPLPVLDLRGETNVFAAADSPAGYLKLEIPEGRIALAVDDVPFLLSCRPSAVEYADVLDESGLSSFTSARIVTDESVVHILDPDRLGDPVVFLPAA